MGLILKDKLQKMIIGYPTVSDKYNVAGGIYNSATASKFGDLVKVSGTTGYYEAAAGATSIDKIAGFILATNVKLAENYPGTTVQVNQGEAFNLMLDGFIAVQLDSAATTAQITPNAKMCVILATGKVTTIDKASASTIVELPNAVFTGVYETQDSAIVAEVYVK